MVILQYMITVYYRKEGSEAVNVKLFDERSTRSEADEFYLMLKKLHNVVGIEYDKSVEDLWVEVTKPVRRNADWEWVICADGCGVN